MDFINLRVRDKEFVIPFVLYKWIKGDNIYDVLQKVESTYEIQNVIKEIARFFKEVHSIKAEKSVSGLSKEIIDQILRGKIPEKIKGKGEFNLEGTLGIWKDL